MKKVTNTNVKELFININFDGVHKKYSEKADITNENKVAKAKLKIIQQIIKDVSADEFLDLIDTAQFDLAEKRIEQNVGNRKKVKVGRN